MTDHEFLDKARAVARIAGVAGHVYRERLFVPEDPRSSCPVVAFDKAGRVRLVDPAPVVRAHRRDDTTLAGTIFVTPAGAADLELPESARRVADPVEAAVRHVLQLTR